MLILSDLLNLLFPRCCAGCNDELAKGEQSVCTNCLVSLPRTGHWKNEDNPVARIFWGRIKAERVATLFHFQKGGRLQEIMHKFKYKNQKEIGRELGIHFAHHLKETKFSEVNVIVPIPLHFSKLKKRNYNQSEEIAKGLSEILNIEIDTTSVVRHLANETQTMKNRYDRWSNVENIFAVVEPQRLIGKHVLLVDDILTTGATLEACAAKILEIKNTKVSIVALASADIY